MAAPPLDVGATQVSATWALPEVPVTEVGEPGTVAGVTGAETAEAALVPTEFLAVTVNV